MVKEIVEWLWAIKEEIQISIAFIAFFIITLIQVITAPLWEKQIIHIFSLIGGVILIILLIKETRKMKIIYKNLMLKLNKNQPKQA